MSPVREQAAALVRSVSVGDAAQQVLDATHVVMSNCNNNPEHIDHFLGTIAAEKATSNGNTGTENNTGTERFEKPKAQQLWA